MFTTSDMSTEAAHGWAGRGGCVYDGLSNLRLASAECPPETGLDYFGARYYSGAQGRFTSPDIPLADQDPSDPQGWNLYGYGRNNPLRFTDPSGRCSQDSSGGYWDADDKGTLIFSGPCASGTIGNDKPSSTTVQDYEPPSPLLLAVAQGAQRSGPTVDLLATLTMAFVGGPGMSALQAAPEIVGLGIAAGRVPRDVQVGGREVPPPRASGKIGTSPAQEAQLQADIAAAKAQGATDIRVNQAQANAQGQMVGLNRPDLQYTLGGRRYYIEYERRAEGRGFAHTQRIQANDPSGVVQVKIIP